MSEPVLPSATIARPVVGAWICARAWPLVVGAAVAAWSAVLFATVRADYLGFRLARFDLGNIVQAVWSTAQGRPLEVTLGSGEQAERLASHVDPILVLLAPVWALFPSPLTLAAVQIAAVGAGAFPVFWLARRHLRSEPAAGLLAAAYLAYPWLAWTALDAFHPVTLAIPLLLFAIWFLDTDRLGAFAVCAILVAATGEVMGLAVAGLGLWYLLARGRRRAGIAIAASGVIWTVVCLGVIVPSFRGEGSPFVSYYAAVGGTPQGILRTAVTDPTVILSAVSSTTELGYLFWLAAPLAGLFLLSPGLAALALPQFLANAMSSSPPTTDPRHHYVAGVVPFLVAAAVVGLARLPSGRRAPAAALVLGLCVTFTVLAGTWSFSPAGGSLWYQEALPSGRAGALAAAVKLVPDDAAVSVTNKAGSHVSARRHVYSAPQHERADWIIIDMHDPWLVEAGSPVLRPDPQRLREFRQLIESDADWLKVFEREGVLVFRRADAVDSS